MSVLIEALTLVVWKGALEESFPGGVEGFLEAVAALAWPPRFACADDAQLVNVSFYERAHAEPTLALLRAHGLGQGGAGLIDDLELVDQHEGPASPRHWLEWRPFEEGRCAEAWLLGTSAGQPAADAGWTPERSRGLVRRRDVDEPGRLLRLAEEHGVETWLDLKTGRQLAGLTRGPEADVAAPSYLGDAALEPDVRGAAAREVASTDAAGDEVAEGAEEDPAEVEARIAHLRERIVEVLRGEEIDFEARGPFWVEVPFTGDHVHGSVRLGPSENGDLVRIYTRSDMCVPEERRAAACEALTRANWGLPVGSFEMDLRDGELVFKGSIFLADGELGDAQLASSLRGGVYLYDKYFPALMRVVYGGASPEKAISEIER